MSLNDTDVHKQVIERLLFYRKGVYPCVNAFFVAAFHHWNPLLVIFLAMLIAIAAFVGFYFHPNRLFVFNGSLS